MKTYLMMVPSYIRHQKDGECRTAFDGYQSMVFFVKNNNNKKLNVALKRSRCIFDYLIVFITTCDTVICFIFKF